ncbi:hypothetical protein Q5P01_011684 [Channa striata]|uniref:Uncharacterized protein n=1 Tax=Channa striata TaxID=64152 RepID=A0AA88MTS8_CHASR|nr:hypothetical protein Q5P01_011684 [Channa striata]
MIVTLTKVTNQPYIRPSYLRPRPSQLQLALIRADWSLCSLTSDMSPLQGLWGIKIRLELHGRFCGPDNQPTQRLPLVRCSGWLCVINQQKQVLRNVLV